MGHSSGLINWQWLVDSGRIQEASSNEDYILVGSFDTAKSSIASSRTREYMIKVSDFLKFAGDGEGLTSVTSDATLTGDGTDLSPLGVVAVDVQAEMAFAGSDQTTPLVVATNIAGMFAEFDMTLQSLFAGVGVLGTGSGGTRIMIQKNGVDMLTGVATIDFGESTSLTAAAPVVIDPAQTSIEKGDRISVDIIGLSGGATEAGLQIVLNGIRA